MGIKKIKELVSKVKEVKNIFTKKKIESPYDKVTIHIKNVKSLRYILHPEFLEALINAVKEVKIGQASALKQLKEKWEKLKDPFVKILEFLIEQYEASEKTNANFIKNETLEIIDTDITSFMQSNKLENSINELDKNRKKLSELEKKMQDHEKLITERKKSIQSQEENSRNIIEQVKSKLKDVYQESVEVEIQRCNNEYDKLAEKEIKFVKVKTIDDLARYINSLESIDKKIAKSCRKLNNTAKGFFNQAFKDPHKVSTSILDMFASLKLDSNNLKNITTNTKDISTLKKNLDDLVDMITSHNIKVSEKKGEITSKRISLEALPNFDAAVNAGLDKTQLTAFLLSCIKLYRLLCGIDTVDSKALTTCLKAVCDARKGSFDAKEILHAVAVVYKRPEYPLENKLKELEKHEKTKNNLAEELAKVKEGLEKAKKEIEDLLALAEPMLSELINDLKTNTRCLNDKLLIADKVKTSLNYLKGYLVPVEKIIKEDLKIRNEEYRTKFKESVSGIKKASDYGDTKPLLMFVMAFCQYLTNIMNNVKLSSEKNLCTIEKTLYDASFDCYDLGMPVLNHNIQINFISTARKFIEWIQNLIELIEHSSKINTKECMELLGNYENHPYRKMLLKVQKNK